MRYSMQLPIDGSLLFLKHFPVQWEWYLQKHWSGSDYWSIPICTSCSRPLLRLALYFRTRYQFDNTNEAYVPGLNNFGVMLSKSSILMVVRIAVITTVLLNRLAYYSLLLVITQLELIPFFLLCWTTHLYWRDQVSIPPVKQIPCGWHLFAVVSQGRQCPNMIKNILDCPFIVEGTYLN